MATDEKMAWAQLERAIKRLEAEQRRLRCSVDGFQSTLGELGASIDDLGTNLTRFHDSLANARTGARKLGAQSRKLAATMDGYIVRHGETEGAPPADSQPDRAASWARAA